MAGMLGTRRFIGAVASESPVEREAVDERGSATANGSGKSNSAERRPIGWAGCIGFVG